MAAPGVGEQLEVQDPLEGPEQDSGQVADDISASVSMCRWAATARTASQAAEKWRLSAGKKPFLGTDTHIIL